MLQAAMPIKFQHTRALLANIARDNEGVQPGVLIGPLEGDDDADGGAAVSGSIIAQVSTLIQADNEDGLKTLLRDSFGVPDDENVVSMLPPCILITILTRPPSSTTM